MPIYEYVCQDCGEKYERFVRSGSAAVQLICPRCGSCHGDKALSLLGRVGAGGGSRSPSAPAPACGPVG